MDFDTYELDPSIYDEMFLPDGSPREHCRQIYETLTQLSAEELGNIQERVMRSFSTEGITFVVYGDEEADERIIPIDCVPRAMSSADWDNLEKGLTQRLKALNAFLEDVYGEARIIRDGVIPADVVMGCPQYRTEMRGFSAPYGTWVGICGTDLVRTNDGWKVLEDNLRVPSGVSYMLANRKAAKASLRRLYRTSRVREVEHYGRALRETLLELAPSGRTDPTIVLLTPGVYNSAFYEHIFLAQEIGAELVEGQDLVVKEGMVYMRTTNGLKRVDIVYRRVDDDFLDPLVFREDSLLGVPGLVHAYKLGNVALVNAPGTGVADDKSVYAYVPDMVRFYLGEEPILQNVDTRLCRRPEDLEYTLDNLQDLVVKQVGGSGGYGMLIGPHSTAEEREDVRGGGTGRPGKLHLAAGARPVEGALPDRRAVRAAARGPKTLCAARTEDAASSWGLLPGSAASGELGGELQPRGWGQGFLGIGRLTKPLIRDPKTETLRGGLEICL